MTALFWLFLSALSSTTLLPGTSEAVLLGLLATAEVAPWPAVLVATTGNLAGAAITWAMGRYLARFKDRSWYPVTPDQQQRAEAWFRRWGSWSLLFSWLPVVGDPLTLVAGALGVPFPRFLLLTAIGKFARYAVIVGLWSSVFS